jgi:hypothetical protein
MLDRETRREKIVEARKREKRVKCKVKGDENKPSGGGQSAKQEEELTYDLVKSDVQMSEAERHFLEAVQTVRFFTEN